MPTPDPGGWEGSPSTFAWVCMQLASTSAPLGHHNRAPAAAHLDPWDIQGGHTSLLTSSTLWFSFLFSERTPENSVPTAATLTTPAGEEAPPIQVPSLNSSRIFPLHTSCSGYHISSNPNRKTKACKGRGNELSSCPPQVILPDHGGGSVTAGAVGRFKEPL